MVVGCDRIFNIITNPSQYMTCEIKRLIKSPGAVNYCRFAPECTFHKELIPGGRGDKATFGKCLDEETAPNVNSDNSSSKQVKSK